MHLHAKMDQWHREEDGSYKAEVNGWELAVKWRPESPDARRGFWFEAKGPGGREEKSDIFEEIEHAMAHAERVAGEVPEPEVAKATE
jgi:hypothetical protein